jgi:uncharacterized protein with von Willebrand factor type A (vWA) domain
MQLLNERDFATRKAFYEANAIAYVARPGHGKHYKRAGRFKKSSNLNVALELSIDVEKRMKARRPSRTPENPWTHEEEQALYEVCLREAVAETQRVIPAETEEEKEKPRTLGVWAAGNIRIGELILMCVENLSRPRSAFD